MFLHRFRPDRLAFLQAPVQIIDLFPHLCGDHIADLARVFAGHGDAAHDAVGVLQVVQQEADHIGGAPRWIGLIEAAAIAGGVHQRQPGFGATRGTIKGHGFTDLKEAGDVFGPLQVAMDPIQRIGDPAQHGTTSRAGSLTTCWSSTIQVSLQPPPWEEFTTSDPRFSATRVSPPGLTQFCFPRST